MTRWRTFGALAAIVITLLVLGSTAGAAPPPTTSPDPHSKLAPALAAEAGGTPNPDPAAHDQTGRTVVQVRGGSPSELASALVDAGGTIRTVGSDSVVGAVPPSELDALAADQRISLVTVPRRPLIAATSEGVHGTGADKWQSAGLDGRGVKVGVVDLGFSGFASAQSAGDLGSSVVTNATGCSGNINGTTGHGLAVAEIVHQMAPAASLYLTCITFDSDASAAEQWLQANGVTIVNASIGDPLDGRGDGSGDATTLAGAVRAGRQAGQLWSVAAGNSGTSHADFNAADTDADGYLEMDNSVPLPGPDASETGTFSIGAGGTIDLRMKWDAWPTSSQSLVLCVWRGTTSGTFLGCRNDNQPDPSPTSRWTANKQFGGTYTYAVKQLAGPTFTGRVDIFFFGDEVSITRNDPSGSLWEPGSSPYAMTVGAFPYYSTGSVESFSSRGPNMNGDIKPDISGPDGVTSNIPLFDPFFGTSAATPHVTGAAALAKQANPAATADQIEQQFLQARSVDGGPAGPDDQFGSGRLDMGPPAAPFGSLDGASTNGPGSIAVGGWALDPDAGTGAISVHVYVDSSFGTAVTASSARQDVANAFGYGPNHGFGATLNGISGGTHTVCAYAINVDWGTNVGIGCKVVNVPSGSPFGSVDAAWAEPGSVTVAGWGIDPDTTQPIAVHVYVDSGFGAATTASANRTDVGNAFPGYGAAHGYGVTVNGIAPGSHQVCAYGINVGVGSNSSLGCKSVNVMSGSPFGSLDVAQGGTGTVTVAGWSIDPDSTQPIPVHVYIGSSFGGAVVANLTRDDVASFFPGYGPNHGYSLQVSGVAKGSYTVCAYGINTGPGSNGVLGCRSVTVG